MSTYPGESPTPADDGPQDTPAGTEPTQPYAPQTPYHQVPGVNPNAPGAQPSAQPQYGYPPQPGQQAPYPPPPGALTYSGYSPVLRDHPQATLAMVLGLVGLVGAVLMCGLPLVVSPFAWAVGRNAVKEIEASRGTLGGESQARAGMIMGIIGTVLLILAIVLLIGFIVLIVIAGTTTSSTTGSSV